MLFVSICTVGLVIHNESMVSIVCNTSSNWSCNDVVPKT